MQLRRIIIWSFVMLGLFLIFMLCAGAIIYATHNL